MIVYQCEDSLESIFTAIYNAYEEKRNHADTKISLDGEWFLFAEYLTVKIDEYKVKKVINTLMKTFGETDYMRLCLALASPDTEKAQAVYQTVVHGLNSRCGIKNIHKQR